jgi:hypothetical protein
MKYATFVAIAAFVATSFSAFTQEATTPNQEFLLFSARSPALAPLSPGHAFVSFGTTSQYEPAHIESTYGFYPCEGCSMINDEKPGRVVKGFWKNRNKKKLEWVAIKADTARTTASRQVVEKWSKVRYNLFRRNCVKFISEVAEAQGLETPKTLRFGIFPKFPQKYVYELAKANPGRTIRLQGISQDGLPVALDENRNEIPDLAEFELEQE